MNLYYISTKIFFNISENLQENQIRKVVFFEAVVQMCSAKKVHLEISQNSQENTCARGNFIKKDTLAQVFSCEFCKISKCTACNFIQKDTLTQVLSCEFCEISKSTFFTYNTSGGCVCFLEETRNSLFYILISKNLSSRCQNGAQILVSKFNFEFESPKAGTGGVL